VYNGHNNFKVINMSENSQMTDQIFTNIDTIGGVLESTVDLSQDVAPFMTATLAKIKQLALAKEGDYEAQYELFQIATNYLPNTINSYCGLPIEYRNTRIVKADKTARQLLIENLKIFKKQVSDLEKQFYSAIENKIKVESSFVHEKYAGQLELATELDSIGEDGFVNQFEFSQYKDSTHYKDITFKRELTAEEIQAKERAERNNQRLKYMGNTVQNIGSSLVDSASSVLTKIGKGISIFIGGIFEVVNILIAPIFFFGIVGLLGTLVYVANKDNSMMEAVGKKSADIHNVMAINLIPTGEFVSFVNSKTTELVDSDYRKENINVSYDSKKSIITMQVSDVAQDLCMDLIDKKEEDFDGVNVKVNGMPLPQDNTVSERRSWRNENHTLCHLEDGNKVTLEFNNQKIYNFAKGNISLTEAEKIAKIAHLEKEIILIEKAGTHSKYESHFNAMRDMVKDSLAKVKAAKTVDSK
jgi:hypothetical protein